MKGSSYRAEGLLQNRDHILTVVLFCVGFMRQRPWIRVDPALPMPENQYCRPKAQKPSLPRGSMAAGSQRDTKAVQCTLVELKCQITTEEPECSQPLTKGSYTKCNQHQFLLMPTGSKESIN